MAVPAATAVTTPDELIVAIEVGTLPHVPPDNELVRAMAPPTQTGLFPAMGPGPGFTVTTAVTVPQVVT